VKPEVQLQLNLTALASRWILPIAKNTKETRYFKEEGSEGRRGRKHELEIQAQTVLTLGLDQITKFIYRLDGHFDEGKV
jgi:hypothetical protein